MGARILAQVPEQVRQFVEPLIGFIVAGIHEALSIAIANSMWLGVGSAVVAVFVAALMPELPLRREHSVNNGAAVRAESPEA
jgi:hypothetical protein